MTTLNTLLACLGVAAITATAMVVIAVLNRRKARHDQLISAYRTATRAYILAARRGASPAILEVYLMRAANLAAIARDQGVPHDTLAAIITTIAEREYPPP